MKGEMKCIGLIGGMSWESSIEYYRIINQVVRNRLGGLHSARCLMHSVDFQDIEDLQQAGHWKRAAEILGDIAFRLEQGGADCILICTNTMHVVADEVQEVIQIPLLHIADATAERVLAEGINKVGLLGTKYTMEMGFYRDRLVDKFGLDVQLPTKEERILIDDVIFKELVLGKILEPSRSAFLEIIDKLINQGAEGIILGCTEIGLLVNPEDVTIPTFDTAQIHAEAAVDFALR